MPITCILKGENPLEFTLRIGVCYMCWWKNPDEPYFYECSIAKSSMPLYIVANLVAWWVSTNPEKNVFCFACTFLGAFFGRPKFVRTKHEVRYRSAHLYLLGFIFDHQNVYNVITTCMFSSIMRRNLLSSARLTAWYGFMYIAVFMMFWR
jgi:hypothetical protein